jgi:hypothetical protein
MPALASDGVGLRPLNARVLDLVGESENSGHARQLGRRCRRQSPVRFIDELAGIHAALERLICFVRAGAVLGFCQILSVDCLAMVDVRRQLRGRSGRSPDLDPPTRPSMRDGQHRQGAEHHAAG